MLFAVPFDWFVYWRQLFSSSTSSRLFPVPFYRLCIADSFAAAAQASDYLLSYWLIFSLGDSCSAAAQGLGYLRSYWLICLLATAVLLKYKLQVICGPIDWFVYWRQLFCLQHKLKVICGPIDWFFFWRHICCCSTASGYLRSSWLIVYWRQLFCLQHKL